MIDVKLLSSRARLFNALSDRTRLEIVDYFMGGERCVCEIIPALGKAQSTTSVSLDQLYRAGILKRRQEGKKTLYGIRKIQ